MNASYVTRWDTLQEIVHSKHSNSRRVKKFHSHAIEDDDEDKEKKNEDEDSNEEYVLISTLTGLVSHGSDTWLVDSGASLHMTGYKYYFQCLVQKGSPYKVNLGGDYQYPIKGMGESFYKLDYQCPKIEE